jgi:uncharacterized damage-inducible protein DinB
MATEKIKEFIEEFRTVYDGDPWYGRSLQHILSVAEEAKVFEKPNPETHSVYELLMHIFVWRDLLLKRLNGDGASKIEIDSKEDWTDEESAISWKQLRAKMDDNQAGIIKALSSLTDDSLELPLAGTKHSLRFCLKGHIEHDIYHAGQIALAIKSF